MSTPHEQPDSGRRSMTRFILSQASKNWMLAALVVTSGCAYLWPGDLMEVDPFRLPSQALWWLVSITMFCLGLVVSFDELEELRKRPTSVLLGVVVQTTWMPFLAWITVAALSLDGDLAKGVILVGCVPGAMASNVLTMTARGNVSYSISLTTVATLLSPITVPLTLSIVGGISTGENAFNPVATSITLFQTVVVPVILGVCVRYLFKALRPYACRLAPWVASIALLWIIMSVVAANRGRIGQVEIMMLVALLVINLLGYLGGFTLGVIADMPPSMTRALSLEVGMQNAGLGTVLAASLLGEQSLAQIPTAVYTFGCMLTGTLLASYLRSISSTADELPAPDSQGV